MSNPTQPRSPEVSLWQMNTALDHLLIHWEQQVVPRVTRYDPKRGRDLQIYIQTIRALRAELNAMPEDAAEPDLKAAVHSAALHALLGQPAQE